MKSMEEYQEEIFKRTKRHPIEENWIWTGSMDLAEKIEKMLELPKGIVKVVLKDREDT